MINMKPINPLNLINATGTEPVTKAKGANGSVSLAKTEDPEKLMEVCKEFESIFLNMILKQSRTSIGEDGLTEKSYGREIFEEMQDEEMAKSLAKGQGVGLAQQLYKQLNRNTNAVKLSNDNE